MKLRTKLFALMTALVLLSSCTAAPGGGGGSADEAKFSEIRQGLTAAAGISFTAQIRADYGDKVLDYTLDCVVSNGETRLTVKSPELIAGVTATVKDGGAALSFDGLVLDPAAVGDSAVTPLTAPALIVAALREGHAANLRREKLDDLNVLVAEVLDTQNNTETFWLNPDTGALLRAEIASGGRVIVTCTCEGWSVG